MASFVFENSRSERNMRRVVFSVVLLCVSTCGCSKGDEPASPTAFVAASTKDAFAEVAAAFTRASKVAVKLNADDSGKLATQIVEGAPAHLFLSANDAWAAVVQEKGFVQEVKPLLGNSLVLVVPKGNPAQVKGPADLSRPEVKRLALAGPTVPAGIYARQALKKLELLDELEKTKRIVSGDNVRMALTYVERGETEAGIVYGTDAQISKQVEAVHTFDPALHEPIRYPLVLLRKGHEHPAGRAFFDYLQSPAAAAIFRKHGFTLP